MNESRSPFRSFKEKICTFAQGQHGIRNPFVMAAVDPEVEHKTAKRLAGWSQGRQKQEPAVPEEVTIQPIWLDELLPQTEVYNLLVDLGGELSPNQIEETMQDTLAEELVQELIQNEVSDENLETHYHVILFLHLGSLYPFSRASELLDELDRRNVKSTIGIPFPGDVVNEKLGFFGDSRHYYPAHQISGQIREVHLQE